jgi:hypothetical protein
MQGQKRRKMLKKKDDGDKLNGQYNKNKNIVMVRMKVKMTQGELEGAVSFSEEEEGEMNIAFGPKY